MLTYFIDGLKNGRFTSASIGASAAEIDEFLYPTVMLTDSREHERWWASSSKSSICTISNIEFREQLDPKSNVGPSVNMSL